MTGHQATPDRGPGQPLPGRAPDAVQKSIRSSVWPVAQRNLTMQRRGRYVPGSGAHPGRMAPALAAHAIRTYTRPGDLVLDPMCGIGTSLVEAAHLGRDGFGVDYEPRWAALARDNLALAAGQGATGHATIVTGDARDLPEQAPPGLIGQVRLVLTSPPYGPSTHGRVEASTGPGRAPLAKWHGSYGERGDHGNLAHTRMGDFTEGLTQILTGCARLLQPDGVVVIIARPWRQHGELIDLPSLIIDAAEHANLHLADRCVALLAGQHKDRLIPRHSFLQLLHLRRARTAGRRQVLVAHEDVLVFGLTANSLSSRESKCPEQELTCGQGDGYEARADR